MGRTVTYTIELLVGLACMALVLPAWRRGASMRVVAVALAVAGAAATAHAVIQLV